MDNYIYSTGRRKTSSARIFLKKGSGLLLINNLVLNKYFNCNKFKLFIFFPFKVIGNINYINLIDLYITVKGGGIWGQAVAIRHGISRVLVKYDTSLFLKIKSSGLLTRDSRKVERKKFGLRKSRCKPQYSKR